MATQDTLLDAFTRVCGSMHRILADLSEDELTREPHPPIGWLGWRLTRIQDSNLSRLWGQEQLWIAGGWAKRFGMEPLPFDFGIAAAHTREQVRSFRAPAALLLAYHDAAFERTKQYLAQVTQAELDRELDEPQYTPLPTVSVRIISVVENGMNNAGQMGYLKAYHRLGGWFPQEGPDPGAFR